MRYFGFNFKNKLLQFGALSGLYIFSLLIITSVNSYGQMDHKTFKLAIVQMKVEGGKRKENIQRAKLRIEEAVDKGAQVILLPEAMDLGWTDPSALYEAQPVPGGTTSDFLSEMARKNRIYICSGMIEKEGRKVYNSAALYNQGGELILKHRKIHELDIGHPYYSPGERLNVIETEYGTFGLMICADATAKDHVLTRSLAYMGADIILSPSSWAMPADHDNIAKPYGATWHNAYIPVAKEFRIWIAGASNVGWMTDGPWKGWKGIGSSMVVNPDGEVVLTGPYGVGADTILYIDIKPERRPGQGTTWNDYWHKYPDKSK